MELGTISVARSPDRSGMLVTCGVCRAVYRLNDGDDASGLLGFLDEHEHAQLRVG